MRRTVCNAVLTTMFFVSLNVLCFAQSQTLMTRHTRDEVVSHQVPLVGHLDPAKNLELTLVLQHRNQTELDQFLNDVNDRYSPNYRHFLTVEQFTERFGPSRDEYEYVKTWAKSNGLKVLFTARNRQIVRVSGAVRDIEGALNVHFGVYQHPTENRTFFAPDREPTPNMSVRLWSIAGLDNFSTPQPMFSKRNANALQPNGVIDNATTGSCPSKSFCGSDMRAAYYTAAGGTLDGTGQSVGIFNFVGTDLVDLTTYFTNAKQTNNVPITLDSVDGQNTLCQSPSCDDTEPTIDMVQSISMAPGMSSLVMYIGKGGLSGQTLDDPGILNGMATANPLNHQLSCSWAWRPADPTTDDPFFQQFQAQGQTFFVASGDSGNWASATFVWPADDVYIVSVGGTSLKTVSAGGGWSSETGWSDSGGGITKNGFAIPSWQTAAAAGCSKCSKTLRNGPDVSANADFTFYVCADQTTCTANFYGGTSFAAPMWAGFLALVNQQAATNGSSPVGFINPALYNIYAGANYSTDFHDITSGGNTLGSTVGYDLSTGIGSPDGQPLVNDLAGTVAADFSLSANPTSLSVAQGSSGTSTITSTTVGGFNTPVNLSASGQPTGVTITFNPTSITGTGNSTMTMAVAATVTPATYTITVTGTAGAITHTTTVSLTVTGTTGTFTIAAAPSSITITRGASGQVKVTTTGSGGFNSSIALKAVGVPTGVQVKFNPLTIPAPGTGSSKMSISVGTTATTGTFKITVAGQGGGVKKSTVVTLTIN